MTTTHDPLCPSSEQWDFPCRCTLIARVRADERKSEAELVTSLARWKNEATVVLAGWESVYEALGSPGRLGESRATAALTYVKSWQSVLDAARVADAARRDTLADLRAKVEGLTRDDDQCIWLPDALALIDEATQ